MTEDRDQSVRDGYERSWSEHAYRHGALALEGLGRMPVAAVLIGRGHKLLDVGCGDGSIVEELKGKFDELHGVDFAGVALDRAAARGITTASADLDRDPLPYPDASFDRVACMDVIEHVYDPVHLLRECHRVTAPDGRLVVTTINMRYLKFLISLAVRGRFPRTSGDTTLYDGGHLHYFTQADVAALLRDAGYAIERRVGIIGTARLSALRRATHLAPVREFLSTGMAIAARRPA